MSDLAEMSLVGQADARVCGPGKDREALFLLVRGPKRSMYWSRKHSYADGILFFSKLTEAILKYILNWHIWLTNASNWEQNKDTHDKLCFNYLTMKGI